MAGDTGAAGPGRQDAADAATISAHDDSGSESRELVKSARAGINRIDSAASAFVRAVVSSLSFMFQRPIRLFRPMQCTWAHSHTVSSLSLVELMARREGKKLGVPYLRRLIRQEKVRRPGHSRSPFYCSRWWCRRCVSDATDAVANVAIGFTLFQTYTLTQDLLLHKHHAEEAYERSGQFTPTKVVAIAGAVAGAAQCIIAAPLDNVRLVLQRMLVRDVRNQAMLPAVVRHPVQTWRTIVQAGILPFLPENWYHRLIQRMTRPTVSREPKTGSAFQHLPNHLRLLSRRVHGTSLFLSLIRDSAGFSCFFVSFEWARYVAFHASLAVDNVVRFLRLGGPRALAKNQHVEDDGEKVHLDFSYNASHTVYGRITAAFILVCGGAIGALLYELVSRPIEYMRMVLWYGLHVWDRPRRPAASAMQTPSKSRIPPHRWASVAYTVRPVRTMYPVPRVSYTQSVRRLRPLRRRLTLPRIVKGVPAHRAPPSHPPPPPRNVRAMRARAKARKRRYAQSTFTKLLRYARLTAPPGSRMSSLRLLVQTYFVRPFVYPELCKASAPRPWGAAPPALPPPPTPILQALRPEAGTLGSRFWHFAQRFGPRTGKLAAPMGYMLNRLASPYGCAFLAFAWMGGAMK